MYYCEDFSVHRLSVPQKAEKHVLCILFAHTQKHTHIFSHCTLSHHTDAAPIYPPYNKKTPHTICEALF